MINYFKYKLFRFFGGDKGNDFFKFYFYKIIGNDNYKKWVCYVDIYYI